MSDEIIKILSKYEVNKTVYQIFTNNYYNLTRKTIKEFGMKKLVLSGLVVAGLLAWGGNGGHNQQVLNSSEYQTKYNLTNKQKEDLVFMYQEEKVARDVYITLANKWNLRTMSNIQKAEQQHMNAVKSLLIKYNIPVPVMSDKVGEFDLPKLQKMYDDLVAKGMKSAKDALEVGKLIEITDIKDLEEMIPHATPDMKIVFENLKRGSENHLRAFNRSLSMY